jgi:signal transduction histidine kinase
MQGSDVPSKYMLVATRMFSSAKRMSKLINDLIDFTRTHLGPGIPIRVREGSFATVCKQVVDELRTYHPEQRIELQIPAQLDAVFDDSRIAQMLSNLVGNAIQHGATGTPVTVTVTRNAGLIVAAVNNRGPVIPCNKIASIFDPLVRFAGKMDSEPAEQTSLSLGLFISREIVHAHGGQIDVASTEAEGTTFTVTLPSTPSGSTSVNHAG